MADVADDVRRAARAHLGARRWAEAENCLAGALGAADAPGDLHLMRALARAQQGDRRGARDDLRQGLARGASLDEAVVLLARLGLVNEAMAAIERHAAEPRLRSGRLALRFGRYREGIAAL